MAASGHGSGANSLPRFEIHKDEGRSVKSNNYLGTENPPFFKAEIIDRHLLIRKKVRGWRMELSSSIRHFSSSNV